MTAPAGQDQAAAKRVADLLEPIVDEVREVTVRDGIVEPLEETLGRHGL
jgi:hypothetical protein